MGSTDTQSPTDRISLGLPSVASQTYSAATGQCCDSVLGGATGGGAASSIGPTKRANRRQPSLAMSSMTANTAGTNTSDSRVDDISPPITAIAIGARNSPPDPSP